MRAYCAMPNDFAPVQMCQRTLYGNFPHPNFAQLMRAEAEFARYSTWPG
jgi:hypothetical protein